MIHCKTLTWLPARSIIFPLANKSSTTCSLSKTINPKPRERLVEWSVIIWCSRTLPYLEKKFLNSSEQFEKKMINRYKLILLCWQEFCIRITISHKLPSIIEDAIPPTKIFFVLKVLGKCSLNGSFNLNLNLSNN